MNGSDRVLHIYVYLIQHSGKLYKSAGMNTGNFIQKNSCSSCLPSVFLEFVMPWFCWTKLETLILCCWNHATVWVLIFSGLSVAPLHVSVVSPQFLSNLPSESRHSQNKGISPQFYRSTYCVIVFESADSCSFIVQNVDRVVPPSWLTLHLVIRSI